MSEELIIRSAAPTLAGLKTGSLFPCRFDSREQFTDDIRGINRRLGRKGLRLLPLRIAEDNALLYLYRPARLQRDLENAETRDILARAGYDDFRPGRCLPRLLSRFRGCGEFPHEIGLFLSYPPEDVKGFIADRDNYKAQCMWKIYGDEEKARTLCAKFQRCTECYCRLWQKGRRLEQLAVAG